MQGHMWESWRSELQGFTNLPLHLNETRTNLERLDRWPAELLMQ